jgi:hypothetical protein
MQLTYFSLFVAVKTYWAWCVWLYVQLRTHRNVILSIAHKDERKVSNIVCLVRAAIVFRNVDHGKKTQKILIDSRKLRQIKSFESFIFFVLSYGINLKCFETRNCEIVKKKEYLSLFWHWVDCYVIKIACLSLRRKQFHENLFSYFCPVHKFDFVKVKNMKFNHQTKVSVHALSFR